MAKVTLIIEDCIDPDGDEAVRIELISHEAVDSKNLTPAQDQALSAAAFLVSTYGEVELHELDDEEFHVLND